MEGSFLLWDHEVEAGKDLVPQEDHSGWEFKGANPGEGQVICAQEEMVMKVAVLELLQEEGHLQQFTFHGLMCSFPGWQLVSPISNDPFLTILGLQQHSTYCPRVDTKVGVQIKSLQVGQHWGG